MALKEHFGCASWTEWPENIRLHRAEAVEKYRAAADPEKKPATKPETKPETKSEAKSEAKPETKTKKSTGMSELGEELQRKFETEER